MRQIISLTAKNIALFGIILSIILSASYQQNRFFDASKPKGLTDSNSYLKMAKGDYDVNITHRRRFLVPEIVSILNPYLAGTSSSFLEKETELTEQQIDESSLQFTFWIVNSLWNSIAGFCLFYFLGQVGLTGWQSFAGTLLFAASRVVDYSSGTALVDSVYFAGIGAYSLSITKGSNLSVLLTSILAGAFTKETGIVLPLLPLLFSRYQKPLYIISAICAVATFCLINSELNPILWNSSGGASISNVIQVTVTHLPRLISSSTYLFTAKGIYDLVHGFGILSIFALIEVFMRSRSNTPDYVPAPLKAFVIVSLGYALLSGNLGRMFFGSYPVLIFYSIKGIERLISPDKLNATYDDTGHTC